MSCVFVCDRKNSNKKTKPTGGIEPPTFPARVQISAMSCVFVCDRKNSNKKTKPTGGIEPPTFRLQSECSTTKLSRLLAMMLRTTFLDDAIGSARLLTGRL